jgi:hypothetical protein
MATRPASLCGVGRAEDEDAAGEQICQEKDPHALGRVRLQRSAEPDTPVREKTWALIPDSRFTAGARLRSASGRDVRHSHASADSCMPCFRRPSISNRMELVVMTNGKQVEREPTNQVSGELTVNELKGVAGGSKGVSGVMFLRFEFKLVAVKT